MSTVSTRSHRGEKIDPCTAGAASTARALVGQLAPPRYCSVPEQQAPHAMTGICCLCCYAIHRDREGEQEVDSRENRVRLLAACAARQGLNVRDRVQISS
jgi:hypothetical protein